MNDVPHDDHGLTTLMQRTRWSRGLRYVSRDRSLLHIVSRSRWTGLLCLAAFGACAVSVVISLLRSKGVI